MAKRSYSVTILGEKYALKSDADATYIDDLARTIDARMRELRKSDAQGRLATPTALAVLTALQLADELERERAKRHALTQEIRTRTQALRRWLRTHLGSEA